MAISTAPRLISPARRLGSYHSTQPAAERPIDPRDPQETLLARYYRDVAPLPVLKPNQEFELARRVEESEISLWTELLQLDPGVLEPLLSLLQIRLELDPADLQPLRRPAAPARGKLGAAALQRQAQRRAELAAVARAADADRELLDQVLGQLRALDGATSDAYFLGVRVSVEGKTFDKQLRRVLAQDRIARRARQDFIQANLRLVVTIARRFNFGQLPLHDLIQEGNIGLLKAIGRYDHRRGFRFSTYASWWIRHTITRAMADKGGIVRVPVYMQSTAQKLSRTSRDLSSKLGRTPTTEEICSSASLDLDRVRQMQSQMPRAVVSLDSAVNEDDDDQRRFIELMPEDDERTPVETIGDQQVYDHVREIWSELKPMEADILRKRFGLEDGTEHTLVEIGQGYKLSRERIRQIQERALIKIRRALERRKAV